MDWLPPWQRTGKVSVSLPILSPETRRHGPVQPGGDLGAPLVVELVGRLDERQQHREHDAVAITYRAVDDSALEGIERNGVVRAPDGQDRVAIGLRLGEIGRFQSSTEGAKRALSVIDHYGQLPLL